MEDPIKIIHKYKNNNNHIQYHINIYIGDILDESCMRVLKKIKNLNLYDTLSSLDDRETKILIKHYGDFWYEKFFNKYHSSNKMQFSLLQVSLFYLVLIIVLSYVGFKYSVKLGSKIGIFVGDAAGSALGALLGVFLSYQMFVYARRQGMIVG